MSETVLDTRKVRSRRKYSCYQTIELDWVDRVPDHWIVKRLKWSITACQNGIWGDEPTGDEDDVGCVRVADFDRLRFVLDESVELTKRSVPNDKRVGRLLNRGDLLLEKSGGGDNQPVGALVLFDSDAVAVCSNFVAKVAVADGYCGSYLRYLHACLYANRVNTRSMKQATGIQNLDSGQYFDEKVAFPSLDEQRAIAAFLDRETARIDALVAKKQRLIELLEEKSLAVIAHAVTKGLISDRSMKDSGIDWVGSIPWHWTVASVGHRYEIRVGKMLDSAQITGSHLKPYLRVADVQWGEINTNDLPEMDFDRDAQEKFRLRDGDLLVNEGGSYVGRSAIWRGELKECFYQKALHRLRPLDTCSDSSEFFFYLMLVATKLGVFVAGGNHNTIEHLPAASLRKYRFAFPPKDEQLHISKYLEVRSTKLTELTSQIAKTIDRLQEYRTALISAAVTGQIDVREEVRLDE